MFLFFNYETSIVQAKSLLTPKGSSVKTTPEEIELTIFWITTPIKDFKANPFSNLKQSKKKKKSEKKKKKNLYMTAL